MTKKAKNRLSTDEVRSLIQGRWEYSCEVVGGGLSFPQEVIITDEKVFEVNSHGGTATFYMPHDGNFTGRINIKGQRESGEKSLILEESL